MQGCDILFSEADAAEIRREFAKAMGDSSPCAGCAEGRRCPLLPDDLGPMLESPPEGRVVSLRC